MVAIIPTTTEGDKSPSIRVKPKCIICGFVLERKIQSTGIHHRSCPWNYFIHCNNCGYDNSLSKLLGFGAGCSSICHMTPEFQTQIIRSRE
jgi:hypothetical protein